LELNLDLVEVRVLGALIEKEITTPEYYPLSLNALVNACNQKSNRDPAVSYDEDEVDRALESLRARGLALRSTGAGSRVPKHAHRFSEQLNPDRRETAILCELMLRGPQTVGELRTHTERMHSFDDTGEVETVLERLIERTPDPLVMRLPRRAGEKEVRFTHLLSGAPAIAENETQDVSAAPPSPGADRVGQLESEVARLRDELESLKAQFAQFRRQFE
jgi:uncharacterized protein YceH (UPF0502 family)